MQGDFNPDDLKSNTFELQWPPNSPGLKSFPEVDKAEWFGMEQAKLKILKGQIPLLEELEKIISSSKGK